MTAASLRRSRAGFALPTVLTMVAILTLIFITCILALHDLFVETAAASDQMTFETAALSAEGQFTWLATTEPSGVNALMVGAARQSVEGGAESLFAKATRPTTMALRIDGRPYQWSPGANSEPYAIRVQDLAGLVNVNVQSDDVLMRLFNQVGVQPGLAEKLTDELQDFIDIDNLRRTNGAEAADYVRAGRQPPPNRHLRSVSELVGLLDWDKLTQAQQRALRRLTTAQDDSNSFNLNTAPAEVLMVQFGIGLSDAQRIIATRETTPYSDPSLAGLTITNDVRSYTFPNGRYLFKVLDPKRGFSYQSEITLTPGHVDRPVWILNNSVVRINPNGSERPDQLPVFPTIGAAPNG